MSNAEAPRPDPAAPLASGEPKNPFADFADYARNEWRLLLASLPEALKRLRRLDQVNYELGVKCLAARDMKQAIFRFRFCLLLNRNHADAMSRLALCYYETGQTAEAVALCRKSLALKLDQPELEYLLATATGAPCRAIPRNVVINFFNERAPIFDREYLEYRHYKGPEQMLEALQGSDADIPTPAAILDLGCGTGLVGRVLKPHASRLVGVDIAPAMADVARAAQYEGAALYDEVVTQELHEYLNAQTQPSFDLVTAGLTLRYVGDMAGLAQALPKALKPGGVLCFTVEKLPAVEGYALHPEGMFRHSAAYLTATFTQRGFARLALVEAGLFNGCEGLVCLFRYAP